MTQQQTLELKNYPHDFSLEKSLCRTMWSCHSELYQGGRYMSPLGIMTNLTTDPKSHGGAGLGIVDTRPEKRSRF